jgi:hypothetical protein
MEPINYFIIFAGLFSIAGGIFNWDWFMNNRRAYIFVKLFKRTGARIFYVFLGLFIIAMGWLGKSP